MLGGPTIWPSAVREGLGQRDLGLVADLAIARSVFVTRRAAESESRPELESVGVDRFV